MFLDSTYFQGELYIPNLRFTDHAVGVAAMVQAVGENTLEWFVDKYEREFLDLLLGKKLSGHFIDGMNQEPVNPIWQSLMDTIYAKGRFSYSPAANYVFYWLCRRGRAQMSMNGEVRGREDFADIAPDADVLAKAWNDMLPRIHEIRTFIFDNWAVYESYSGGRGCVCRESFTPINSMNL